MSYRPLRVAWRGISCVLLLWAIPSAGRTAPAPQSDPLEGMLARLIGEEAVSQGAYKKLSHL
ncbi:MAG TPA: hypothetical protein VGR67_05020, partial [Candidatus Polarisedimenticolia bacterium]|nr:hypothetical protein [Candidatus Polarisedimenticolia bacterium]